MKNDIKFVIGTLVAVLLLMVSFCSQSGTVNRIELPAFEEFVSLIETYHIEKINQEKQEVLDRSCGIIK